MGIENDAIKAMIELAETPEDADSIITKFTPCQNVNDRLYYLRGMFPVDILGRIDGDNYDTVETDYQAVLAAIVNQKWR